MLCHNYPLSVRRSPNSAGRSTTLTFYTFIISISLTFSIASGQTCASTAACYPGFRNLLDGISENSFRTLSVSSTCGTPNETLYRRFSQTLDFHEYACNQTSGFNHPEELMHDTKVTSFPELTENITENDVLTYWQSKNTISSPGATPTEEFVSLNLTHNFLIRSIIVMFTAPLELESSIDTIDMRPDSIIFEKQDESSGGWSPWRYYAENCSESFPSVLYQSGSEAFDSTTVYCEEKFFSTDPDSRDAGFRQQVIFNPNLEYPDSFTNDLTTQRYFLTSAVRFRLLNPADKDPISSYYAIADLKISGQCGCFGHATRCKGPNSAVCVCQHNTTGDNCDQCLPLYNNKPWKLGRDGENNECEVCDCTGRASSCHYDSSKGYGVCDGCQYNTAGDRCELCADQHYLNPNYGAADPEFCVACNCSIAGSEPSSGLSCNNYTGQCSCKKNTMGRACDMCIEKTWNLQGSNTNGCQDCDCDISGSFNNTNYCDSASGACQCKSHTEGYKCQDCQDGYYNKTSDNPDGCVSCQCNPGGSHNSTCDKATGQCHCRPNIGGKNCDQPDNDFFVPKLDHLIYEAEYMSNADLFMLVEREGQENQSATFTGRGFLDLGPNDVFTFSTSVNVPETQFYDLVVRYESSQTWNNVLLTISTTDPSPYYCGRVPEVWTTKPKTAKANAAYKQGFVNFGKVCLSSVKQYTITLTLPNEKTKTMLLDSLVILPNLSELDAYTTADSSTQAAMQQCFTTIQTVDHASRESLGCGPYEYSIMAELYGRALACSCVGAGTILLTACDPFGGQCMCKTNVMGLSCDTCDVYHFDFGVTSGCRSCTCDASGSMTPSCDRKTGQCPCKANVTGEKCTSCIQDHYGHSTGNGCSPCQCLLQYSLNNTCSDVGQCLCKTGVTGLVCDACQDGYALLESTGCTSCNCDTVGSQSSVCDPITGECPCKNHATGNKCDVCQSGYFGLGVWGEQGCIGCVCSGHSLDCTSAPGWYRNTTENRWSMLDPSSIDAQWTGVDGSGLAIDVTTPILAGESTAQFIMRITNSAEYMLRQHLYFVATEEFLGDKRAAYGQTITFALKISTADNPVVTTKGDIILEGTDTNYILVAELPSLPGTTSSTVFSFQLREAEWKVGTTMGRQATYTDLQKILTNIKAIKIRGKYSNDVDSSTDLSYVAMNHGAPSPTSNVTINNVEQCSCPTGFQGQFCESCSAGYTRQTANGGPFVSCVRCDCNGHVSADCDPESTVCSCTHNTSGDHCESCLSGYYGDATAGTPGDCKPCMCPGNVIAGDINVFTSTCSLGSLGGPVCQGCASGHTGQQCQVCAEGWFGQPSNITNNSGKCQLCDCNDRSNVCDTVTGECRTCVNNTAGPKCEICAPGYYGDAMTNSCVPCGCSTLGSTGVCNHMTGDCECHPNVEGKQCDECVANSYDFTSGIGCTMCNCSMTGSFDLSCHLVTGQCPCRPNVIGQHCDQCADVHWNFNSVSGCDACNCDVRGTTNTTPIFGQCDHLTGQCPCAKSSIDGRRCEKCTENSKGFFPACELCGECYQNWETVISELNEDIMEPFRETLEIWTHYDNMTLMELQPIINNLKTNISKAEEAITTIGNMSTEISLLENEHQQIFSSLYQFGVTLQTLQGHYNSVYARLLKTLSFNGSVPTMDGKLADANMLMNLTNDMNMQIQSKQAEGNATWLNVQKISTDIQSLNFSTNNLLMVISMATIHLTNITKTRQDAELLVGSSFENKFQQNDLKLKAVNGSIQVLEGHGKNVATDLQLTESIVTQADGSAQNALATANSKRETMKSKVLEGQVCKYNASQVQQAMLRAQSAAINYKDTATAAKANITHVNSEISMNQNTLAMVANQITETTNLTQTILKMVLQPVVVMQYLVDSISSTAIDKEDVNRTYLAGSSALGKAETALALTLSAAHEAEMALEQVQGIENNLAGAKLNRNTTGQLLKDIAAKDTEISNVISVVGAKASSTKTKGIEMSTMLGHLMGEIAATGQCFGDSASKISLAKNESEILYQKASDYYKIHNETVLGLEDLKKSTPVLQSDVQSVQVELQAQQAEMAALNNQLENVQQITNLTVLLDDFSQQKTDLLTLGSELGTMETEIDNILNFFEVTDPASSSCTDTHS